MVDIYSIKEKVYTEPTSEQVRPHLVEYIQFYIDEAKSVSRDELLHGKGNDIASIICGALAWQGADGVEGDDWIDQEREPVLWKILEITSRLDIDANDADAWQKLFAVVDEL
ncbi:MAG: hypothetical protein WAS27_02670 [Candidatus Saccharimonadales bacterium]